ncbi:MAG: hypothetical protein HC801_13290 [Nitrospira sp.]|nr:hypothetical protein [Nitrospira sp.]
MSASSRISSSASWLSAFQRTALRHFPDAEGSGHRTRDYLIAALTFLCVGLSSLFEISASVDRQQLLGGLAWLFLGCLLFGETKETKVQVAIAVIFATVGEHFASIYMGGYTYRFENVPAYVPPGHGMVYLTAVALARSGLFVRHPKKIALFVIGVWGTWSLWGISGYPDRGGCSGGHSCFVIFFSSA